jgi:hypothetical protein
MPPSSAIILCDRPTCALRGLDSISGCFGWSLAKRVPGRGPSMTWVATSAIIVMLRTRDARNQVERSLIVFVFATNHLHPTACKVYNLGKTIDTNETSLCHVWTTASIWL